MSFRAVALSTAAKHFLQINKKFYIFVIANGPSCNKELVCAGRRNYATGRAGSLGFRITRTLFAIAKILSPVFTSLSHKESPESGSLFLLA